MEVDILSLKKNSLLGSSNPIVKDGSHGTVGAVVMDFDGNLAAATSTGGLLGNEVGRIGDTPIAGMGVFADNKLGKMSFNPNKYYHHFCRVIHYK